MNNINNICVALISLPLLNGLFISLVGKHVKSIIVGGFSSIIIAVTALITLFLLWHLYIIKDINDINNTWYVWGQYLNIKFEFGFLLDELNIIMLSMVSIISFIVHMYSISYMYQEPEYNKYFSYISFFTAAMYLLIIANNFLQLFVGWELVGFTSYLLIGFWFKQETANKAALKAILINRLGDLGLLVAIAIIFGICEELNYTKVFSLLPQNKTFGELVNIISIGLFIAIITKSAQIPLHTWLPDSMEAPTPVSALIHSATMVVAGIFLIARMFIIFEHSKLCLNLMLLLGSTTALLMSIIAMTEIDIKRIFAYSTISQLGIMLAAMGASAYSSGILYLLTHSCCKALLFLGAGILILTSNNIQNINDMPKLKQYLPTTYWCMLIASLGSVGIPLLPGFISKQSIINAVLQSNLYYAKTAYYLINVTTWITAIYIFRVFFVVFHQPNKPSSIINNKTTIILESCLIILAICVLLVGYINNNYAYQITTVTGFTSILGVCCALILYWKKPHLSKIIRQIMQADFFAFYNILQNKYFFNKLNKLAIIAINLFAKFCAETIEILLIDQILTNSFVKIITIGSQKTQKLQTGSLSNYLLLMLTGVLIILLWLFINIY